MALTETEVEIEVVKYYWPQWYVKVTPSVGRVQHWGPWNTKTAAEYCARILRSRRAA